MNMVIILHIKYLLLESTLTSAFTSYLIFKNYFLLCVYVCMQYAWVHLTVHRVGQKSKSDALTPELKAFVEDSV